MNNQSQTIINNLLTQFPTHIVEQPSFISKNPIGIEIEVKWKYYFPDLWDKYLIDSSYKDLPKEKQEELSLECDKQEAALLPKLNKTVECGLKKGEDKYWEFAFDPVTDISLIDTQLQILREHQLVPHGQHSLHITIGNMKANKDSYYLLLLLETISCDQERIRSAFNKSNPKQSGTWARKGYGGLFQKESRELMYGSETAVELRTLALDTSKNSFELLKTTAYLADIIIDKQNNRDNSNIVRWNSFVTSASQLLEGLGLTDTNWKKPNLSPEYWIKYIDNFDIIQSAITPLFNDSFPDFYVPQKRKNLKV